MEDKGVPTFSKDISLKVIVLYSHDTTIRKHVHAERVAKGLRKGCERVAKGLMLVMCERWVGNGTDCHILTQSSFDHSSTSSSFCWAAQPGSWGPKPPVWRWLSLRHLVPNCNWNSNCDCNSNWTLPASNSNWLKPSVTPGYIIIWRTPASCTRTYLHRIQPCPQANVILQYLPTQSPTLHHLDPYPNISNTKILDTFIWFKVTGN